MDQIVLLKSRKVISRKRRNIKGKVPISRINSLPGHAKLLSQNGGIIEDKKIRHQPELSAIGKFLFLP